MLRIGQFFNAAVGAVGVIQTLASLGAGVILGGLALGLARELGTAASIVIGVGVFLLVTALCLWAWQRYERERMRTLYRERALELQAEVAAFAQQLQGWVSRFPHTPGFQGVQEHQHLLVLYEIRFAGRVQRLARELQRKGIVEEDDKLFDTPVNALHARAIAGRLGEIADGF
jgi:hypothetical protein